MHSQSQSLSLMVILLAALAHVNSYINTQMYHNHQELESEIKELLTDSRFGLVSCSEDSHIQKMIIEQANAVVSAVIVCNIHARQFFSSEVCLELMKRIKSKKLQIQTNWTIFYQSNSEREKAFQENYCLRTNKNGVDLNRNFPTGFATDQHKAQLNPGDWALSEDFTKCLDSTVEKSSPDVFLDVHTGQFSIFYSEKNQKQFEVLNQVKEVCPNCRMRTEPGNNGMAFMDMKKRKKVEWSVLFQIFGGINYSLGRQDQCFVMFNPSSKKSYDFYLERGVKMIEKFMEGVVSQKIANINH